MENKQIPQFADDYFRFCGRAWPKEPFFRRLLILINSHALRYLRAYRKVQQGKDPLRFYAFLLNKLRTKYGIGLESRYIGKGLYLGHPYNITVSEFSQIGDNCNLNKGTLIGPEKGMNAQDAPVIGDRVWIGVNAVVSGKVTIGNNVLIAPNAQVNFDVPPNSIVIGNPAKIISRQEDAVEGYIHHEC